MLVEKHLTKEEVKSCIQGDVFVVDVAVELDQIISASGIDGFNDLIEDIIGPNVFVCLGGLSYSVVGHHNDEVIIRVTAEEFEERK